MNKFFCMCFVVTGIVGAGLIGGCSRPDSESAKGGFVDFSGIDSTVKPGDDFFRYVNGRWYDTAKIADDQVGVGSYSFLNIPQRNLLQHILDSVSKAQHADGSIEQKVGDFYASGMDTNAVNQRGYEPIRPILAQIDAIGDIKGVVKFASVELKRGNRSIIGFGISPDNKNSSLNIAHLGQAGIGLPDRDYYFKTDSSTLAIQRGYINYIATLLRLTGVNPATAVKDANTDYGVEKQLAAAHKTRIELRDINANYHKTTVSAIGKAQPNIGWDAVFVDLDAKTDSVDVAQPAYYDRLNALLKLIPLDDWKIYVKATTLENYATSLSRPFVDAAFEMTKVISGQAVQKPRAQVMTEEVDGMLGEALGQLYVKRYFNEDAKKRVLALVNNLQKAFESRIKRLDWMSDSTKQKAIEKLYAITKKIGYPDKWRDYNQVQIDKNKYFENLLSLSQNEYQFELAKLNKPVDRTEWQTTPSTVTAYYNPSNNEIVFPAGILQFPYFDFAADDAINYGGIGMVIGHEMTHAFDDQGAQYDKYGNVKNWWTKEDYEKFRAKTQRVVDLYSTFTVLDTVHVKGALTLGENTADNGGIAIAYDAFKLTPEGQDSARVNGYTPDQRFYLSIARIWRVKTRDAYMRMYVNTNPHSPAKWRVNGPCMSAAPWYKAFNVQVGDSNYLPEDKRIKIW